MIIDRMEQVIELILAPTCFAAGLAFLEARNRGRTLGGRRVYTRAAAVVRLFAIR